jgi:hypothetical protein
MPDAKPTPSPTEERDDGVVLLLLTTGDQRPWSVEEVIREHGHRGQAIDALTRLYGAGLIHRTQDDFVWATRAAIRAEQIAI